MIKVSGKPEELKKLAVRVKGMGVNDPKADDILEPADWDGFWPVAANGKYTGKICRLHECGDGPEDGYALGEGDFFAIKK